MSVSKFQMIRQAMSELSPPSPTYVETEIPSLEGKTFLVTGGYAGVGLEVARILYHRGGKVIIAGRSESSYKEAVEDITKQPTTYLKSTLNGGSLQFVNVDLSDLTTVKPAAQQINRLTDRLDVVWYNAGVMIPPAGSKTAQGYELQWGTNVVGHFLLNRFLSPLQLKTAASSPPGSTRTVWVSSNAHLSAPGTYGVNFDDINNASGKASQWTMYAQSKAGDILLASEYARRVSAEGIVSNSLNPGGLKSKLQRSSGFFLTHILRPLLLYHPRFGALTELYAGLSPTAGEVPGGYAYYLPWGRKGFTTNKVANAIAEGKAKELWTLLEKETDKYM